jgi:hypothetical protein
LSFAVQVDADFHFEIGIAGDIYSLIADEVLRGGRADTVNKLRIHIAGNRNAALQHL